MTTTAPDIDAIFVEEEAEAKEVLNAVREAIALYGFASVSDVYDLVGVPSTFNDTRWGWRNVLDFANSKIISRVAEGKGFEIPFPRPQPVGGPNAITQVKTKSKLRLWYFIPKTNDLIDASLNVDLGDPMTMVWVDQMVKSSPDLIFFLVTDTTDLPEEVFE